MSAWVDSRFQRSCKRVFRGTGKRHGSCHNFLFGDFKPFGAAADFNRAAGGKDKLSMTAYYPNQRARRKLNMPKECCGISPL